MVVVPAVYERGGAPRGEPVSLRQPGTEQGRGACCGDVGTFDSFSHSRPRSRRFRSRFFKTRRTSPARATRLPLNDRLTVRSNASHFPSLTQTNQCALPDERSPSPPGNGTPFVSGGEALFLLLLLLTVSMCVSVLLSPESRRRRRERLEREAREKARALHREQKRWARSVKTGMWLTQPDGAVCVCVADADGLRLVLDGDASRSRRRRRRRAAAKLARINSEADDCSPGTLEARGNPRACGDGGCGGSSADSSGASSDESDPSDSSETDSDRDDDDAAVSTAADVFVTVPIRVDSASRAMIAEVRRSEASGSGSTSSAAEREEETRPGRLSEEVAPADRLGEANV